MLAGLGEILLELKNRMKLAFSSVACPSWDLATMVQHARDHGYDGIELRGLQGQMHLPLAPELASNPGRVGELMRETGIELVCLCSSASFHVDDPSEIARNLAEVREYLDLAASLGCPFVRVHAGEIPRARFLGFERREAVLGRVAAAIRQLVPYAAERRVTVLIENGGDFADSAAMWYVCDAVDSPVVKCCWSPFAARIRRERPTTSIPRLGARIGLVQLSDGKFGVNGSMEGYAPPGQGEIEIPRLIQLLKGIGFGGYLVVHWPKLWVPSLADADAVLPAAAQYIRPLIDETPIVLTAYKGDKNAPKYATAADPS